MNGPSLLQAAVDELYSSPMAEFTARRKTLAAAARKSGDREAAAEIAGLRKPTLSADTLNRLVRAAEDEVGELLELGARLRSAERALNGAALRELSTRRRQLVGELTQLAFDITDQPSPSPAVRAEVTATLNAALADEQVADRLLSGALVTQASWDGFGSSSLPELAVVLPLRPVRSESRQRNEQRKRPEERHLGAEHPAAGKRDTAQESERTDTARTDKARTDNARADKARTDKARTDKARAEQERTEQARHAAELLHRERLEAARAEADQADGAAEDAQETLSSIDRRVGELSLQLAHERRLLAEAQRAVGIAETRRRAAHLALTRAGGAPD